MSAIVYNLMELNQGRLNLRRKLSHPRQRNLQRRLNLRKLRRSKSLIHHRSRTRKVILKSTRLNDTTNGRTAATTSEVTTHEIRCDLLRNAAARFHPRTSSSAVIVTRG